jgi:heme exporter protein CcmD
MDLAADHLGFVIAAYAVAAAALLGLTLAIVLRDRAWRNRNKGE